MVSRSKSYALFLGFSLLAAVPALAEDTPSAGAGAVVAPDAGTPAVDAPATTVTEPAPAVVDAAPNGDVDADAAAGDQTSPPPDQMTPDAAPSGETVAGDTVPDELAPDEDVLDENVPDEDVPGEIVPEAVDPAAFLDEAYTTCVSALENPEGAYDIFDATEWWPETDEGSETAYYRQISGEKWVEGIGQASLFYSVEVFPSATVNYCMISVDNADAVIPIANLLDNRDLTGLVRRDGDRVYSIWEDASSDPHLFVQADQSENSFNFVLDATLIARKSAADLSPLPAGDE